MKYIYMMVVLGLCASPLAGAAARPASGQSEGSDSEALPRAVYGARPELSDEQRKAQMDALIGGERSRLRTVIQETHASLNRTNLDEAYKYLGDIRSLLGYSLTGHGTEREGALSFLTDGFNSMLFVLFENKDATREDGSEDKERKQYAIRVAQKFSTLLFSLARLRYWKYLEPGESRCRYISPYTVYMVAEAVVFQAHDQWKSVKLDDEGIETFGVFGEYFSQKLAYLEEHGARARDASKRYADGEEPSRDLVEYAGSAYGYFFEKLDELSILCLPTQEEALESSSGAGEASAGGPARPRKRARG